MTQAPSTETRQLDNYSTPRPQAHGVSRLDRNSTRCMLYDVDVSTAGQEAGWPEAGWPGRPRTGWQNTIIIEAQARATGSGVGVTPGARHLDGGLEPRGLGLV
jgi:hypothetical protein